MDANQITDRFFFGACRLLLVGAITGMTGCSTVSAIGDAAAKPLEYIGLIQSSADDAKAAGEDAQAKAQAAKDAKAARERAAIKKVTINLFAGKNLNSDASGQGLALVTRIYTLRDPVAMQQAPYEAFTSSDKDASPFGSDVVTSREVVLTPGQQIDASQDIAPDVTAIAVVALFRNPSPARWRVIFNIKDAAREGIVVGANACALTVTSGLDGNDVNGRSLQLLPPTCPR